MPDFRGVVAGDAIETFQGRAKEGNAPRLFGNDNRKRRGRLEGSKLGRGIERIDQERGISQTMGSLGGHQESMGRTKDLNWRGICVCGQRSACWLETWEYLAGMVVGRKEGGFVETKRRKSSVGWERVLSKGISDNDSLWNRRCQYRVGACRFGTTKSVSAQFLHLQISTFDKSSIPTLTHSRMEIVSLSFPLYSYPPLRPYYRDEQGQEHEDIFRYSRVVLRQPRQTTSVTIRR